MDKQHKCQSEPAQIHKNETIRTTHITSATTKYNSNSNNNNNNNNKYNDRSIITDRTTHNTRPDTVIFDRTIKEAYSIHGAIPPQPSPRSSGGMQTQKKS